MSAAVVNMADVKRKKAQALYVAFYGTTYDNYPKEVRK